LLVEEAEEQEMQVVVVLVVIEHLLVELLYL
jgi:hypothetical protein